MNTFYDKNFTLGIIGGGQLGRLLIQSAIDFNVTINVLDPDLNAPCKNLVNLFTVGSLMDKNTVLQFGKNCDIITYEIEHINVEALFELEKMGKKVFPSPRILEIIQDKGLQKQFLKENNIPTAPFQFIETFEQLISEKINYPIVHKTRKGGYDGNGVNILNSNKDLANTFKNPSILEEKIDFEKEIAVIVARNEQNQLTTFPPVEMVFHPTQNLVEYLISPANITKELTQKATNIALQIAKKFELVGILAVEMFVTKDGQILVNEVAPRPHNSGHQTIEGNFTSQYQQQLRAIFNLPLGNTDTILPSAMVNILGEQGYSGDAKIQGIEDVLALKGIYVHMYGKKTTRPFRKMGHVTIVDKDSNTLLEKIKFVQEKLKVLA